MAWADTSALPRPDSIPESTDPFIAPKRREARAHWLRVATLLPRRAKVLEVGAGSCLVSKWLAAARPDLVITASDCGDYPIDQEGLGKIVFQPKVAIEQLPFADASFDAVISQFGFEYARREPALGECVRVLRSGGRLSFLMHARDGALQDACALRVEAGKMLSEEPSVLHMLSKAAQISEPGLRSSLYRLVLAQRIADRLQSLAGMEADAGIFLPSIRGFLQGVDRHIHRAGFSVWLSQAQNDLADSLFVGEDQLRAALDQDDIAELSNLAQRAGLRPGKTRASGLAWAWSALKT